MTHQTDKDRSAGPEHEDAPSQERKERVIHTRVPAVLEQELKRLATSLRVPVSNVVRAILEDAVAAVDVVGRKAEGEMRGMAERLAQNRDRLRDMTVRRGEQPNKRSGEQRSKPLLQDQAQPQWLGYQPLLLASATECSVCGQLLAAGSEAYLGIGRDPSSPRAVIGPECLPSTGADAPPERES